MKKWHESELEIQPKQADWQQIKQGHCRPRQHVKDRKAPCSITACNGWFWSFPVVYHHLTGWWSPSSDKRKEDWEDWVQKKMNLFPWSYMHISRGFFVLWSPSRPIDFMCTLNSRELKCIKWACCGIKQESSHNCFSGCKVFNDYVLCMFYAQNVKVFALIMKNNNIPTKLFKWLMKINIQCSCLHAAIKIGFKKKVFHWWQIHTLFYSFNHPLEKFGI